MKNKFQSTMRSIQKFSQLIKQDEQMCGQGLKTVEQEKHKNGKEAHNQKSFGATYKQTDTHEWRYRSATKFQPSFSNTFFFQLQNKKVNFLKSKL